jgi:uncharacterized protein (DUF1501 family)
MRHEPNPDRRALIAGASALGASFLFARPSEARLRVFAAPDEAEGRSLVVVQLTGGNDGLSTIVPFGDDAYAKARPTIAIPGKDVLAIDGYRGLHPGLAGLKRHHDAGRVAIVEGCGYPDPVRSHFKSFEIWHAADPVGRGSGQGWIARLAAAIGGPAPAPEVVVHVGRNAPFSVYSRAHPPVIFQTPHSYRWVGPETEDLAAYRRAAEQDAAELEAARRELEAPPAAAGASGRDRAIARLRGVLADANASSARVRRAALAHQTSAKYPDDELGEALRVAAALLDARTGARIVSVELGGFDTHNNQRAEHDARIKRLDGALAAFLDDLEGRSVAREVLVVVFSEFGRRVAENGSRGTDHGTAGPMLVLGHGVRGGLYGEHPSLTDLDRGDLKFTTDFRRVYATAVESWMAVAPETVLGQRFEPIACV